MVKLFLTDVDGCLTDGGTYYGDDGTEFKRFCILDGMGLMLLRHAGIPCGILTSELTPLVLYRARRLRLDYLYRGVARHIDHAGCLRHAPAEAEPVELPYRSKREAAEEICSELGITMQEVCFVGDDINDIDLLKAVGYPVCPPNAVKQVLAIEGIHVLIHHGGDGAIREICDEILLQQNMIS